MGFYIYKENNITLSINSSSIKIGNSVKLTPTVKDLTDNIPITSGTVEYYLSNGTKLEAVLLTDHLYILLAKLEITLSMRNIFLMKIQIFILNALQTMLIWK